MDRRTYLSTLAGASATATAGCVGGRRKQRAGVVSCDETTKMPREESTLPSVEGSWPSPFFDERNTGHDPDGVGPSGCPESEWLFSATEADVDAFDDPPIVADGTVYAVNHDVFALDAATGEERWRTAEPPGTTSAPSVTDGTLYVANENGVFGVAPDGGRVRRLAATGSKVWEAPTVVEDTVYVGTETGDVIAVSRNGGTRWQKDVNSSDGDGTGIKGKVAVAHGAVYAGSRDESVHAFDASSGTELWSRPLDSSIWGAPTAGNDLVYVSEEYDLRAVAPEDGRTQWTLLDDGFVVGSPALADETLYVQAGESLDAMKLVAVDATTGDVHWRRSIGRPEASPCVVDETVYLGAGSDLLAVNAADGEVLWSMSPEADIHGPPAVVDGVVFLSATETGVFAVA